MGDQAEKLREMMQGGTAKLSLGSVRALKPGSSP
jgi:hypothetical protein